MGLRRMVTKLALAFAAKKGMEMFRNSGGIEGIRSSLAGTQQPGINDRAGNTRAASAGGLGNMLDALGFAGATNGRKAGVTGQMPSQDASIGTLLSDLSHRFNQTSSRQSDSTFTHDNAELDRATARAIVRAMVHTARADQHIDSDEQAALRDILREEGDDARSILTDAMNEPVDANAVAADTPNTARRDVYAAALLVAGDANAAERDYLDKLGKALSLSEAEQTSIQSDMTPRGMAA